MLVCPEAALRRLLAFPGDKLCHSLTAKNMKFYLISLRCVSERGAVFVFVCLFACFLLFFSRLNDLSIPLDADFGKRDLRQ